MIEPVERYRCPTCDQVYEADEAPPVRECSDDTCNEIFVSDDRACPSCNRTFSRRLSPHGCEECQTEDELEAVPDGYRCANGYCSSNQIHDDRVSARQCSTPQAIATAQAAVKAEVAAARATVAERKAASKAAKKPQS